MIIVWDVDGTLFDAYPAIAGAFQDALRALGKDARSERILALAKESLDHWLTVLVAECPLKKEELNRAFGERSAKVTYAA